MGKEFQVKPKKEKGFKFKKKHFKGHSMKKKKDDDKEIANLKKLYEEHDSSQVNSFDDMPLSSHTKRGLADNLYEIPTEIQKECVGLALKGFDVLGAAKTGSGKTLAFLIPVLEILYCNKWSQLDGLGGLIITPTRELALQIFETLRKVGKYHDFSAGLIIGGKDLHFEKNRIHQVNIIICTPGRLLQHMDENPLFDCVNLKVLVLDEADRCLDLGFEHTMNCIIENLPKQRLTLLFSATQTRSVKDLVRLSLKDPKYVSVHENAQHKTPEGLTQSYVICDQHEKVTMLWSFINTHQKQKVIVFFSTCNQVRYVYNIMCRMHPKITLLALHGKLHQLKRMDIYHTFCQKQHAILFATDLAARGLDFPDVNWVVQLDCPEDVETYIHRAGRTARYQKGGECLLVLRPSELQMVQYLESNRIPISEIKINPARMFSPQARMEAFLAKDCSLKESAQRAFVSYFKSVFLMKDKTIFDVKSIDVDKYARSLGLVVSPRIRFIERKEKHNQKRAETMSAEVKKLRESALSKNSSDEGNSHDGKTADANTFNFPTGDSESEEDVLTVKRKHVFSDDEENDDKETEQLEEPKSKKRKALTKVALAKRALKKKIVINKKILFTEEGEAIMDKMRERVTEAGKQYEAGAVKGGIDLEEAKKVMEEEDKWDRKLFREKIKARRREEKRKLKELRKQEAGKVSEEEEDENSVDGSEPDLSWLPDPDKVFSKKQEESGDDDSQSDADSESRRFVKQKVKFEESQESDLEDLDDLTIKEKEELALKLLSSS